METLYYFCNFTVGQNKAFLNVSQFLPIKLAFLDCCQEHSLCSQKDIGCNPSFITYYLCVSG